MIYFLSVDLLKIVFQFINGMEISKIGNNNTIITTNKSKNGKIIGKNTHIQKTILIKQRIQEPIQKSVSNSCSTNCFNLFI